MFWSETCMLPIFLRRVSGHKYIWTSKNKKNYRCTNLQLRFKQWLPSYYLLIAISYVQVYKLPTDRIYVTYFGGDEKAGLTPDTESKIIWLKYLPNERVLPFGCKVFWMCLVCWSSSWLFWTLCCSISFTFFVSVGLYTIVWMSLLKNSTTMCSLGRITSGRWATQVLVDHAQRFILIVLTTVTQPH